MCGSKLSAASTRSSMGLLCRFAFDIGTSWVSTSASATIMIVEVIGLQLSLSPDQPRFGRGTVPALAGFDPNSPPVMEPGGGVRDQPVVWGFLLEFDLGKRDLDPSVLISPLTDEPVCFVKTDFFRIR